MFFSFPGPSTKKKTTNQKNHACHTHPRLMSIIPVHVEGKKKVSPDKMLEMQAKIGEERKALEAKLDMEEEERNKARAELEKREKDLLKAQ